MTILTRDGKYNMNMEMSHQEVKTGLLLSQPLTSTKPAPQETRGGVCAPRLRNPTAPEPAKQHRQCLPLRTHCV